MAGPSLSGRTIMVTGAGGGLGAAMSRALTRAGADVAALDVVSADLDVLVKAHAADGPTGRLLPIAADLRADDTPAEVVARTVAAFGALNGLVNNAGLGLSTIREDYYARNLRFWEISDERWQAIFETNVMAAFRLAKAALPHLKEGGRGRVVNVTTSLDTMIRPGWTPYGPSKAALEACSAIWAADLEATGVTVNVLVPGGPANTPMVPPASSPDRAAMVQPKVMEAPVVWLMSDQAAGFTGRRLTGIGWDSSLDGLEAAEAASAPAAWPGAGQQSVWPDDLK